MPNPLNAAIGAAGLAVNAALGGLSGLAHGGLGAAAGFGLVLIPFALRLYRGGDAKLVIAIGAWLGPALTAWAFLWGVALGAVGGLAIWLGANRETRGQVRRNLALAARTASVPELEARPAQLHVPMAVAFSAGALVALVWRL